MWKFISGSSKINAKERFGEKIVKKTRENLTFLIIRFRSFFRTICEISSEDIHQEFKQNKIKKQFDEKKCENPWKFEKYQKTYISWVDCNKYLQKKWICFKSAIEMNVSTFNITYYTNNILFNSRASEYYKRKHLDERKHVLRKGVFIGNDVKFIRITFLFLLTVANLQRLFFSYIFGLFWRSW